MSKKSVSGLTGSAIVAAEMAEAMAEASRTDAEIVAEAAIEADRLAALALAAEALATQVAEVEAARVAALTPLAALDEQIAAEKDEAVKAKLVSSRPLVSHDSNIVCAKRKLDAAKAAKVRAETDDNEEQQIVALRQQASAKLELTQAVSDRGAFVAAPDLLAMLIAAGFKVECKSRIEIALVFEAGVPTGARAITLATPSERKLTAVDGALKAPPTVSSNFKSASVSDPRLPPSGWAFKATLKPIDGWTFTWLGGSRCVAVKDGVTVGPDSQNKVCSQINGGRDIASYDFLALGKPGVTWDATRALAAGFIAPR